MHVWLFHLPAVTVELHYYLESGVTLHRCKENSRMLIAVCCCAHMRTNISVPSYAVLIVSKLWIQKNISVIEYSVKKDGMHIHTPIKFSMYVFVFFVGRLHDFLCESLVACAQDIFTHVTENNPRMCPREEKSGWWWWGSVLVHTAVSVATHRMPLCSLASLPGAGRTDMHWWF